MILSTSAEVPVDPQIAALPKVELHLHLEGSLRPRTMLELAEKNGVDIGAASANELTAQYEYGSFDDFLALFMQGLTVLQTGEDFAVAITALAAELAAQNVGYAELTTTPFNHHRRGIAMADYVEGLNEGRRMARRDHGIELGWICDIPRELEPPDLEFTADLITGPGAPDGVVAIGLGGPEPGFPPELYAGSFARAIGAGLGSVPHAGETMGPESVWGALRTLLANRIGHGVRALEDPALIEFLVETGTPLEISLTSNVLLGVVASVEEHPLRRLMEAGVIVTLNTDDPAYFRTDLTTELQLAHDVHDIGVDELREMQHTALATSFAPASLKRTIEQELARSPN